MKNKLTNRQTKIDDYFNWTDFTVRNNLRSINQSFGGQQISSVWEIYYNFIFTNFAATGLFLINNKPEYEDKC